MNTENQPDCLRLPIGIQTFRRLREKGCYYVDKTSLIRQMVDEGDFYFLSRPRRFGKSLLVSTLKELFEGNEPLFRGLDIHPHWDWSVQYPVVRLTLDGKVSTPESVEKNVVNQLGGIESKFGLTSLPPLTEAADRLRNLLDHLYQKTDRQVVVLVDEYDKPVLDVLEDDEKARANRDCLREIGLAKIAEVEITERKVPDFEEWIKNAYHELPDDYNGEVINLTEDMPPA
ncbi:MAG: AAA family ATPase [Gammaproteobacteria bacterium]|nr:AAA family ATPase [Gammaproteobacteria bacterium]